MDRPAPLTKDVSEFGHWLRITAIFHQSKRVLRELDGQPAAISDIHHAMQVKFPIRFTRSLLTADESCARRCGSRRCRTTCSILKRISSCN